MCTDCPNRHRSLDRCRCGMQKEDMPTTPQEPVTLIARDAED